VSSPPDGLEGRAPKSRLPEPASVVAPRAASRVCLRRAAPAPDSERCVEGSRSMRIDLARLAPLIKVGPAPGDRTWPQMHWPREGTVGDEPIDGRAAKAGGLHDGWQAREDARRQVGALGGEGRLVHWAARRSPETLGEVLQRPSDEFQLKISGTVECVEPCWRTSRVSQRLAASSPSSK